jgi:energy-coupling factor transporter ATP-binding protein EcfA2
MKLENLEIRDFRGISSLCISLKDELGLIRDCVPIVGPNMSGKTTILDAISLCLMPVTEVYQLRPGLRLMPSSLVRHYAVSAFTQCTVWFSDDEIDATREVLERAGNPYNRTLPRENHVQVTWTFPDPQGRYRHGYYRCEPENGWMLFRGRKLLMNNLHVPGLNSRHFRRLGNIVHFDQQRTGLRKRISRYEQILLEGLLEPDWSQNGEEEDSEQQEIDEPGTGIYQGQRSVTTDPRLILTQLAVRAQVPQHSEATEKEYFTRLCELYEQVCYPHRIGGPRNTDHGLDMEFLGEYGTVYYYDGLSSGQQMLLVLLLQFATRRIHRSIVLIDELELHLHPSWQDRLYSALPKLGEDNQVIFTTHSTHLRDTIHEDFYHCTGDLKPAHAAE